MDATGEPLLAALLRGSGFHSPGRDRGPDGKVPAQQQAFVGQ
jgi:hypothetical protein